jgi:hypothetical protein
MLTSDNSCEDPYDSPTVLKIQDYTQWHTYAIEWSPSRIIWYVDGAIFKYFKNSLIVSPTSVIFNLAVQKGKTTTAPAVMEVDYVKVYELKKDCDQFINSVNYPFSTYNNREKNFIKIGEASGINTLPVGQNVILRASQYIDFAGDFSVPIGASLYADVNHECSTDLITSCTQVFNPCHYNFSVYDNSIRHEINLGGGSCDAIINPVSTPVQLKATNDILLEAGVTITTANTSYSELKIVPCQ